MSKTRKLVSLFLVLAMLASFTAYAAAPLEGWPGIDQLPAFDQFPNPFQFFNNANDPTGDGYVSTVGEWDARRTELKEIIQHYWLGYRWETRPQDVVGAPQFSYEVPNTVSLGTWSMTSYNLGTEFANLANKLKTEAVKVYAIISSGWITTRGAETGSFGPAEDPSDEAAVTALAIACWNAGYSLPYTSYFGSGYAALTSVTGQITAPPGLTKIQTDNLVFVTNPDNGVTEKFSITVNMPTGAQRLAAWGSETANVPFVVDIGGTGAFSAANLNAQGYARVTFNAGDIYNDATGVDVARSGLYVRLYPYNKDEYKYASGALMAWSWAVSQILTALEQPVQGGTVTMGDFFGLDPAKSVVTGHSRYGKSAMFAAAFDDRIAIAAPSENGGAGVQSYRYKVEGKIFNWNAYAKANRVTGTTEIPTVSYGSGNTWFPHTAGMFVDKDNQIPFDSSDIISLVAPRPFFTVSGLDSHWLGTEGIVAPVVAASEVYSYIGKNDIEKNNIAIRARESDHVFYNRDFTFALAIMDREFKQKDVSGVYTDTKLHVKDLFPTGTGISGMSYPAADYNQISDFNSYPFDINSSYIPWSNAGKYTLWTAQENFIIGHDTVVTAYSNAPSAVLVLPDKTTIIPAASHSGETFTFNLTAAQAIYGRYELRTTGTEKENRSVYFAAVSLADSLRHGAKKGDEGEENRMIGFSSRFANTTADPIKVYATGIEGPLTEHFGNKRIVPEQITIKEYGITFHDNLFATLANNGWVRDDAHTFRMENVKFVTFPDYTFQFSMGDIYASATNSGKDGAANFDKAISWNVEKYNNGPNEYWPPLPDTVAERNYLNANGLEAFLAQYRPAAPAPKATNFKAEITNVSSSVVGNNLNVVLTFSEPLKKGEFGFGMDVAGKWVTSWNEDGTQVTLSVASGDIKAGATLGNLIIFRLMDAAGNLIGGPIEKTFTIPTTTTTPGTIVSTLSAYVNVNFVSTGMVGETVYVFLADKFGNISAQTSAVITDYNTPIRFYIPAAPAAGEYYIVTMDSNYSFMTYPITVVPYNTDIWAPVITENEAGKAVIVFADAIGTKSGYVATLNGAAIGVTQVGNTLVTDVDYATLATGAKFVIKGVKYPVLFPSYSFTFTVVK